MALVIRSLNADVDATTLMQAVRQAGEDVIAAEDIDFAAPCHFTPAGVVMSNAAAADADAVVDGIAVREASSGEPITLAGPGTRFRYGTGLTVGATLYLAATDGRLDDVATPGDFTGIFRVVSETDIVFLRYA